MRKIKYEDVSRDQEKIYRAMLVRWVNSDNPPPIGLSPREVRDLFCEKYIISTTKITPWMIDDFILDTDYYDRS